MKTEDKVLLVGAVVVAWIIFQIPRRPTSSAVAGTRERTGTVTAGGLTFAGRPSLYSAGQALVDSWTSAPVREMGWNEA